MAVNPQTFHIPDEYATVVRSTPVHTPVTESGPVPALPQKRRSSANSSAVSAPAAGSAPIKKSVSFEGDYQVPNVYRAPLRSEDETYSLLSRAQTGSFRISGDEQTTLKNTSASSAADEPRTTPTASVAAHDDVVLRTSSIALKEKAPDCVDFEIFLTEVDDMLRGVLELSTLHHDVIGKVKLRVVCLFDVSGSMMLKCGRSRQHSKLTKLKKMAVDLVDVLEEDEDYVGLVTFGEGTNVVCPLTKVDSKSRDHLKEAIKKVDKSIDNKTDLVGGVQGAIDVLQSGPEAENVSYRNAIIIFSDGEINTGLMDPDEVVHAVRKRIRETYRQPTHPSARNSAPRSLHPDARLWLSVACVTTGGNVSEAMYLVSKYCGNDAYYYVDSDLEHPEVDMLIPLLLRKTAIAQFVTLDITSGNGAKLIMDKCTREHSVRRRREESKSKQMVYYLHDIQAGLQKHFSIAIDLANYSRDADNEVVEINLDYVDANGDHRSVKRTIKFSDRLTPLKDPERYEKCVLLSAKSDMRHVFGNSCRNAADSIQNKEGESPTAALNDGKSKLHDLMERYGLMAKREETKTKVAEFSRALIENLDKLIESMEKSRRGQGHKWTKIKALSSAVVRETPTVSKLVAKSETVCPLPVFKSCETTRMTALALKLYRKQEVKSVVFQDQNLFDAAKVVMQSLHDIVDVLNQVEAQPRNANTIRRNIITSMVIDPDNLSD